MGLVVLAFISPSMSKTVITCKGGFNFLFRVIFKCVYTLWFMDVFVEVYGSRGTRQTSLKHNHEMTFSKRFCRYL